MDFLHQQLLTAIKIQRLLLQRSLRNLTNEAGTDHPEDGSCSTTSSAPPADGPRFTTDRVEILPLDRWLR